MKKINFTSRVQDIVRTIPKGKTITYKQVAELAGSPGAARAVGTIMKNNYDETIPCHRVIGSDGKMHGYNRPGGTKTKKERLIAEGALRNER